METWRGLEENSDSGMGLLSVTSASSMGSARVGSGDRHIGSPVSQEMGVDSSTDICIIVAVIVSPGIERIPRLDSEPGPNIEVGDRFGERDEG